MTPTEKMIQDGLWRPIEEAPKDADIDAIAPARILAKSQTGRCITVKSLSKMHSYRFVDGNDNYYTESFFTHFRPLHDDRLANALKVAVEVLDFMIGNVNTPEMAELWAIQALAEIDRIAKEKGK